MLEDRVLRVLDGCTERVRIIRKIPPHYEVDYFPLLSDRFGYVGTEVFRIVKPELQRYPPEMPIWLRNVQTKILGQVPD
jgi:hypothetical protein